MSIIECRIYIATLLKYEGRKGIAPRRCQSCINSRSDKEEEVPKKQRKVVNGPNKEIPLDNVGHFPKFIDKKLRLNIVWKYVNQKQKFCVCSKAQIDWMIYMSSHQWLP